MLESSQGQGFCPPKGQLARWLVALFSGESLGLSMSRNITKGFMANTDLRKNGGLRRFFVTLIYILQVNKRFFAERGFAAIAVEKCDSFVGAVENQSKGVEKVWRGCGKKSTLLWKECGICGEKRGDCKHLRLFWFTQFSHVFWILLSLLSLIESFEVFLLLAMIHNCLGITLAISGVWVNLSRDQFFRVQVA